MLSRIPSPGFIESQAPLHPHFGAMVRCWLYFRPYHCLALCPNPLGRPSMKLSNTLAMACLLLAALLAAPAHAAGDPDQGKQLAYTCTGCHGIEGYKNAYPNYHVPRIAGQNYDYLLAALTAYKKGERNHPTMRAQAQSFTDEEIQNLAAFISGAKATEK